MSALISGCETAFFNFAPAQLHSFRSSENRLQRLVHVLLLRPQRLLNSLLISNMLANVSFFAIGGVLSFKLGNEFGKVIGATAAAGIFVTLLLFGEMLPKSIAYSNSTRFCVLTSPICYLLVKAATPILKLLDITFVRPVIMLLLGPVWQRKPSETVSLNQFKTLLESSKKQGILSESENELLAGILELAELRVTQIMCPRVDMPAVEQKAEPKKALGLMDEHNITSIAVYKTNIDNIVGMISQKDLLLNPEKRISELIVQPHFIPEQKTVESLLEYFDRSNDECVIVVDEYGGVTGMITRKNIIDRLLGSYEQDNGIEPIQQLGPMRYRLSGNLSVYEWAQAFGLEHLKGKLTTIGGLVTTLLGKLPAQGDTARIKNIKFTVEKVTNNRIKSVILNFEPISSKQQAEGTESDNK
jgi:CBS domain containing-hemolysin-like protein